MARPRLGFLGVGWIGRSRLEAIIKSNLAEVAAIADSNGELVRQAQAAAPGAAAYGKLEELLALDLDGVVIATPSALHAQQAAAALEAGMAVFCQKPLGRNQREARMVVQAARGADRLLGVDLSYRHVVGMQLIADQVRSGAIGNVFAVDLVFHNAYGPDKPWYYDINLSGGGCVIDLGIHLVDLALWALDYPEVERVGGRLYLKGEPLVNGKRGTAVEDYAMARIDLKTGAALNMTCSWGASAGQDCVIEATFRGVHGALSLYNLNGSFYELRAERFNGTRREILDKVDNAWGGRAALAWTRRLAQGNRFDPEICHIIDVAETLDAIYGR
jgi:predicted dehydrogenase